MRAVIQRVREASVEVDGKIVGSCGVGFLVLVGACQEDTMEDAVKIADRVAGIRIFNDEAGKMNLNLGAVNGSVLAVSNFTLYSDAMKSRRPSFSRAAGYDYANELFEKFVEELRGKGVKVETGIFGADMKVSLLNDGPVTILLDSKE
jgi:D-tyrosyl-tRNA(Tyr) deacylase